MRYRSRVPLAVETRNRTIFQYLNLFVHKSIRERKHHSYGQLKAIELNRLTNVKSPSNLCSETRV